MDFSILYAIQGLRCAWIDRFILTLTSIMGSNGECWLVVGAILLIFKQTRKTGFAVLLSYALVYIIGQFGLKDLIARARPCHIDETIELLVKRPGSYSCPSTHSAWAFGAATAIFINHRKSGIIALAAAALIAFSRLYLFVHFPSDVLFGAVLGGICAFASVKLVGFTARKIRERKTNLNNVE